MPSSSKKQHNFMAAIANNPKFAKKVGIPQSVGKDFEKADKGKKFAVGGVNRINMQQTRHGYVNGAPKGAPDANLNKFIGKKQGGKIMAMQKQKGVKTDEPFNPKNVEDGMKKGGKVDKESKSEMKREEAMDKKQDVAMIKKAFKEHDAQEHKGGKGTKITLKKGGMAKKMAMGGSVKPSKMESVKTSSNRDGIAERGRTKGRVC